MTTQAKRVTNAACPERQENCRVAEFACTKLMGHAGPHVDPATGTEWGHRGNPGLFKPKQRTK